MFSEASHQMRLVGLRKVRPRTASHSHIIRQSTFFNTPVMKDQLFCHHKEAKLKTVQACNFSSKIQNDASTDTASAETNFLANNWEEATATRKDQILAFANSNETESRDMAFQLLREMIRQYKNDSTNEKPTVDCLEAVLKCLVDSSSGDAKATALQAQTIFVELAELSREIRDPALHPSAECYRDLIALWTRAKHPDQAEQIFWELLLPEANLPGRKNTAKQREDKLTSAAKSSRAILLSPTKAHRALLGKSLNQILESWASSGRPNAGKRCDELLSRLGRIKLPNGISVSPNPKSFHFLLEAHRISLETAAKKKNELHPNYFEKAARRVQRILDFRIQRYQSTKNSDWLPDQEDYSWLILVWCHAGAPAKACGVLETLLKLSENNDHVLPPTTAMYNLVLESYCCEGQPQEASLLLSKWVSRCQNQLETTGQHPKEANSSIGLPDETSCILTIRAWGQFSDWSHASKAEIIVDRMKDLQNAPETHLRVLPAPTVEVYNAVLEAWSISKQYKIAKTCTNAERVLESMHKHSDHNRNHPCAPNERSYELVIETYARFGYKLPDRRSRVQKLIRQMNHFGYNKPSDRIQELVAVCREEGERIA